MRIARENERLVVDSDGKKEGRGLYLCKSPECFDRAVKKKQLKTKAGAPLPQEEINELRRGYDALLSKTEVCE